MTNDFSYSWQSHSLTVERLIFNGCLDRSIDPETSPLVAKLQAEVRTKSAGKIIVLDLTHFGMWDTEGIRAIIGLFKPLVEKEKARIGICGPKKVSETQLSQLYEDAKIKFNIVDTRLLPWENTIQDTLNRLSS